MDHSRHSELLKSSHRTHSPDAFGPHGLVETGVDADVRRAHLLHRKLADLLERARSSPLEGAAGGAEECELHTHTHTTEQRWTLQRDSHAVDALVDVDGVLAGHHLVDGRAALLLLALLRCHLHTNNTISYFIHLQQFLLSKCTRMCYFGTP